jgi:hypothetical protein
MIELKCLALALHSATYILILDTTMFGKEETAENSHGFLRSIALLLGMLMIFAECHWVGERKSPIFDRIQICPSGGQAPKLMLSFS